MRCIECFSSAIPSLIILSPHIQPITFARPLLIFLAFLSKRFR
uniref:Uncharacterized protein n=1 Tax=Arundo donax TaxID=35708 RepID=A0A0A9CEH7_ARUDO